MRRHTFCRLCEVGCGLIADIEGSRIVKVRPDRDHPVSQGYACSKGLLTGDIHHDPDRLDQPIRRTEEGWVPTSWDGALEDVSTRLRRIIDESGPRAVAVYIGNPMAFNPLGGAGALLFLAQLGSDRLFSAASQDCANKYAVSEMFYGSPSIHLVPDLEHTDHALLLGTNPRVSKLSFVSTPDPVAKLAAIEARGGTVRFVDPRRVEPSVGDHVAVRPDTDAYLLAAMLCEIERSVGFDAEAAARVDDLDAVRAFVHRYSPERVASVVGIDTERIVAMAREFATAPSACAHMSTGVNMGRQGALAYWLLQLLVLLTGNVDRRGGNIPVARALPPRPGQDGGYVESGHGRYRPAAGNMPAALLPEMLGNEIRALIVIAGNPLLSVGGGDTLAAAFDRLDLMVSVDMYRNATAEHAHHVLPAADWFERADMNLFVQGTQLHPYLEWADPLVAPLGERRTEWQIFSDLGERLGQVFPPGDPAPLLFDAALAKVGLSIGALRAADRNVVSLPAVPLGAFLDTTVPGGRLAAVHADLEPALERAERIFESLTAEPTGQRKLITRRTPHTLNSALQNVERLKGRGAADNPLYVHPDDAAAIGVVDGALVRIRSSSGELHARVKLDDTLRPGVVAMTHGFGNAGADAMTVARRYPGVNVNALAPSGPGTFDPTSSMSQLTGIAVDIAPA